MMATGITGDCDVVKGQTRVPAPPYTHPTTDTTDQDTEQAECQRVEDLTSETPAWFRHSVWWMNSTAVIRQQGLGPNVVGETRRNGPVWHIPHSESE